MPFDPVQRRFRRFADDWREGQRAAEESQDQEGTAVTFPYGTDEAYQVNGSG